MANEKFKIKFGLAVGDTAATVDGTTGDIATNGDLDVKGGNITNTTGGLTISSGTGTNVSLDPASGTATIDGHLIIGESNSTAILTTNGDGNLQLKTGSTNTSSIEITQGDNGDITFSPHGTGEINMTNVDINSGAIDGTTIGANSAAAGTFTTVGATTGNITTVNATTVDTTNIEVTNIKAKDGTAAITIANTTGKVTIAGDLQVDGTTTTVNSTTLDVDDINITLAKGAANAAAANGGGITLEGPTTAATITYASADDSWNFNKKTTAPELQVDNININGNTIISTDTNGAITLAPNGTGDVALTFSNGGNLTNSRNYVFGAIRNTTTDSNGDIWVLDADSGGSGTLPYRGVSIDNSADTAKNAGTLLRNYSNTASFAGRLIFERARGTAASPTTLSSGDQLGAIGASGYSSTLGWINDTLPLQPANMVFQTAEAWVNNTNLGTTFAMNLTPTATTVTSSANLVQVINHNPQAATYRSDAFTFRQGKTGTTDLLTLGTSSATLSADSITFRKSAGTNLVTIASDGTVRMKDPSGYSNDFAFYQPKTVGSGDSLFGLNQVSNNLNKFPQFSFFNYPSTDGINFTPTQNGQVIGGYKFNGNAVTGTTPGVPAGPAGIITVIANENWTSTANGATINFSGIKKGAITDVNFLSLSSDSTVFRADSYTFQDSAGTNVTGNKITYNRVYGQWQYDATVTPAAANTAYAYPIAGASSATDFANIASVGSTSHIIPGALGMYKLQFSVQLENTDAGSEHTAYFWWRKNGTDVPASMGRVGIPKGTSTIAGWDNMIEVTDTSHYWELMYAVDDATHVSLPYYGATAFGPATASMFITLVPIGA